jgi:putative transposase
MMQPPRRADRNKPTPFAIECVSIMSHTYCSSLFHCVFSTKERRKTIEAEIQPRLWAYMGGVAREHGMKALAVGGAEDHVHILLSLPSSLPVAKAMREIKSASSLWMGQVAGRKNFEWQEGYGAFSIGWSQVNATIRYIENQSEHHRKQDFQAEFIAFLVKHRIEYDPRYVLG